MRSLKAKISTLNARYTRKGDFIQSKQGFKEKVGKVVAVPKTLMYTTDPKVITHIDFDDFVMKPNHLSRGLGIRVLTKFADGVFKDLNGETVTGEELFEEAKAIMSVKRGYDSNRGIMIEERLRSHEKFRPFMYGDGIADIRMIFYDKELLFGVARFPTEKSGGYGNTGRGATWGVFLEGGKFVKKNYFLPADIQSGELPFFEEMLIESKKVLDLYQFPFQCIDMTVDQDERVVIIESEKLPQIEVYLTKEGGAWLYKKILVGLTT